MQHRYALCALLLALATTTNGQSPFLRQLERQLSNQATRAILKKSDQVLDNWANSKKEKKQPTTPAKSAGEKSPAPTPLPRAIGMYRCIFLF